VSGWHGIIGRQRHHQAKEIIGVELAGKQRKAWRR